MLSFLYRLPPEPSTKERSGFIMDTPNIQVKEAAASELRALSRTSFSSEGFTREQIEAISSAIEAAIREYDRQNGER